MKLTVTPLEKSSGAKRQGLHYHICIEVDVLSKHVHTLVQYLVGQTTHLVRHCPMSYRYFPHWPRFLLLHLKCNYFTTHIVFHIKLAEINIYDLD